MRENGLWDRRVGEGGDRRDAAHVAGLLARFHFASKQIAMRQVRAHLAFYRESQIIAD